ncbi:hypothetical protein BXP70_01605 [Hymenobacter crusticola]|uniref:Uncharacterized protein n=2 Tax=Hymenobacter crusticola TaxID=1770526 RepID=A0A243WJD2_9BACT|nr:hypothetical protein BXP70_01605 [Hymenobacter crusticola]
MIFCTPKHLFAFLLLVGLASCRSEQLVFRAAVPPAQYVVSVSEPSIVTDKITTGKADDHPSSLVKPPRVVRSSKVLKARHHQMVTPIVAAAKHTIQTRLMTKPNTAAVQEEGEGKPALLVLGILLVLAGVVGGFWIGGGIGFFVGLPIGLLGYYFFMKGLLGPNAWIEVANELFQL